MLASLRAPEWTCTLSVPRNPEVRELSALHTKRLMVTFDESEAERERDVEDATREVK